MTVKYIYNKDLSPSEKIIMIHFNSIKEKEIQLGISSLVKDLSIGEFAVKTALRNLIEKGYISRRRLGQGHPNIYTILK